MKTALFFAVSMLPASMAIAAGHSSTFAFDKISEVAGSATAIVGYADETTTLYVTDGEEGKVYGINITDLAAPAALSAMVETGAMAVSASGLTVGQHQGHPMVFTPTDNAAGFTVSEISDPSNKLMLADPTASNTGPALDIEFIAASISPSEQPVVAVVQGDGSVALYQLNQ